MGGDKQLQSLFGYEVTTKVAKTLKPNAPTAVLLTDTTRYLHLPYVDTTMTWMDHHWDKLATIRNFLHYRNDLHDPRVTNDTNNHNTDQKLWEKWMFSDPIAVFTDVEVTDRVHVPPVFSLEQYHSTSDSTGVIAGKINGYRTQLRNGNDRFLRGELLADTILGTGAERLPGSQYDMEDGILFGITNALGARTAYGYGYTFNYPSNLGLPQYVTEHPLGLILSNDSSTYPVTLQTTAYERLYQKPGAERTYIRRYGTDTVTLRIDSLTTYAERSFYGQPSGSVDANGWYSRFEYDRLGRLLTAWMPGDFARQGDLDTVAYRGAEVLDLYGYTLYNRRSDSLHCYKDGDGIVMDSIIHGVVMNTAEEDTLYASRPITEQPTCPCRAGAGAAKGSENAVQATCDYRFPYNEHGGFDGFYSVLTCPVDSTSPLRTATSIDSAALDLLIAAIDGDCAELEVKIPGTSFLKTYLLRCPGQTGIGGGGIGSGGSHTKREDAPTLQSDHLTPVAGGYLLHVDLSGVAEALRTITGNLITVELRAKTIGTSIQFANGLNGSDVRPRMTIYGQYKRLWDGADYTLAYQHDDVALASEMAAKVDDIHHTANTYDVPAMHGETVRRAKSRHYFGADYHDLKGEDSIFSGNTFARLDSTRARYSGLGTRLAVVDAERDSVGMLYDAGGRLLRTINADGSHDSVSYTITSSSPSAQEFYGFVEKVTRINERGIRSEQYYDAFDRLRYEVADADSLATATQYDYDLLGRLLRVENPKRDVTTYRYDAFGRIRAKTMPDLGMVSYAHDKLGNIRFTQNQEQARRNTLTFNEYDDLNRATLIGEALIERKDWSCPAYCEDSLAWTCTPPADVLENRLTETIDPNVLAIANDDNTLITANPTLAKFPNAAPPMFIMGPLMQGFISNCQLPKSPLLGETSAPVGPSVLHWTKQYLEPAAPATIWDFEDMALSTRFARIAISYDKLPEMGHAVWGTFPPTATWDALAPTGAVRNLKGHEAAVAYRERGSEPFHYNVLSYDERGRVEAILRCTENLGFDAVYYSYNAMNRVTSVTVADPIRSFTTWYGYDRQGRVDSVWTILGNPGSGLVPNGGIPPANVARRPLVTVQRPQPLQRTANQQPDITYLYTKTGQVDTMRYPPVNVLVDYAYNHRTWLDSIVATQGGSGTGGNLLFREVLGYDSTGQIIRQRSKHGGSPEQVQSYIYDGLDRLTAWTQTDEADTTSYTYDRVGNRTEMSESFVPYPDSYTVAMGKNQLTGRTRFSLLYGDTLYGYRYDANGSMVHRELKLDSTKGMWPGRVPRPATIGMSFTEEDRYSYRGLLNRVFRLDSNNLLMDWRYRYSASGEREQKRVIYAGAPDSVMPYPWVYYLLGRYNDQLAVYHGQQTIGTGICGDTGRRVYLYPAEYLTHGIAYTGAPEELSQLTTLPNGTKEFHLSDHLASVRVVVRAAGNNGCDYDPWGNILSGSVATRLTFNDQEQDAETGEYDLGVRKFDSRRGSFTSVDALAEKTPQVSPYVYANANPLRMTDPTGLQTHAEPVKDLNDAGGLGMSSIPPPSAGEFLGPGVIESEVVGGAEANAAKTVVAGEAAAVGEAAAGNAIESRLVPESVGRGFRSFSSFKRAFGPAGSKMEWHHIVEQTATNVENFGGEAIHNTSNLVRLDVSVHRQISAYYSSKPLVGFNGLTVRQWLSTQSFEVQKAFGERILNMVLQSTGK